MAHRLGYAQASTAEQDPALQHDALKTNAVAAEVGATPAQVALAWLLAQGEGIAPIPGPRRVSRLEENVAADDVVLSPEQVERLTDVPPAVGGHHTDQQVTMIER